MGENLKTSIKIEGGTIEEVADIVAKLRTVFEGTNYKFWVTVDISY